MIEKHISKIESEASTIDSIDVFDYSSHFNKLSKSEDGGVDVEQSDIYKLVASVCSYHFQPTMEYPFAPMMEMQGRRTAIPNDLSNEQLELLKVIVESNLPSPMIARICDVLWLRLKSHVHARRSIDAYLETMEKGYLEDWPKAYECAQRAARISNELGHKAREREEVKNRIFQLFEKEVQSPRTDEGRHWPNFLAQVLINEIKEIDYELIGDNCKTLGDLMVDAFSKDDYYELAAKAFHKANLEDKKKQAFYSVAKSWENDANKFRGANGGNGMQIAFRIEKAILAYRNAGEKTEAERLIHELQDANKLAVEQMETVGVGFDMTKYFKEVETKMAEKVGRDAIAGFIQLHNPESFLTIFQAAEKEANTPRLQKIVPATSIVEEGNIVSRSSGEIDPTKADVHIELVNRYELNQSLSATLLEHARKMIVKDSNRLWVSAIDQLIQSSAFVESARKDFFTRALISGLDGDYLVFTHLIIPQIEQSVRQLVDKLGGKTTALRDGIMRERDLHLLLTDENHGKDAVAALGEDLRWELRALLVEQTGPNLRNRVCHGLATFSECTGNSAVYLLWLMLYSLDKFSNNPFYSSEIVTRVAHLSGLP